MIQTGFINSIREIWWDVRPHYNFGTVEIRVCDMPGNLPDVLGLTALSQCLVQALSDEIDEGAYQHDSHPMMVRQNKWRAARFGNRAMLVNAYTHEVRSVKDIVRWMVERLTPIAEKLGCLDHLRHVQDMAERPTWADRQRSILRETGDMAEIVRRLSQEARISS
jgi:carboxylate-amine ligase